VKRLASLVAVVTAAAVGLTLARAQMPKPETVVRVRVEPVGVSVKLGAKFAATLLATIKPGFHINSNKPVQEYLIPTRVELLDAPLFVLEKADFPPGEMKAFGFAPDEQLSVYEGTVRVPLTLRAKARAAAGNHNLRLAFHYQACNDRFCLRPAQREAGLKIVLRSSAGGAE
jgi:hypothetical protein